MCIRDRTDIDARVTFDAQRTLERCLDVAVQAPLHFADRLLDRKPQFDLQVQLLEPARQLDVIYVLAARGVVVVVVAPLAYPHLLAHEVHPAVSYTHLTLPTILRV